MTKVKLALGALLLFFLCPLAFAQEDDAPQDTEVLPDTAVLPDEPAQETTASPETTAVTGTLLDTLLESAVQAAPESIPEGVPNGENSDDDFDEDLYLNPEGPEVTVFYNDRNEADYVEVKTAEKIEEYHYLSHIKYSDLLYVLTDLLRRITNEGYQWSTAPAIIYEKSEEVVLLYRKDLVNDMIDGIVQFPDFKISINGRKQQDARHRYNAGSGRDMMNLVYSFALCLAQAEQTLGINQLEYTMKFFKPE
ncbi:MAG: hypothetical protein LBN21_07300 [Treponema sp.]|nr:hypothetical protein [Treponema sp.]